ncbi:FMN-binding protein [Ruminococcus sp. 1001136sp1]|uniref:FMN-binding protein n=1 Tax=unclassified Ruminococcus TaxID=2608920 RepID=UPI00189C5AA8|nr:MULTISPECIES: FMN-binding protein [unclassified Ruminococcus]MDB8772897.1 FMN-binding protein [Ruminococcus sp. 1001136sp1]MDB8783273.1 FMN-binding protein [Ruminococcus sp. 1001136sp1]
MKKRDSDKNPFEKKNLVKLAPAAVVIAAVAAAGAQAGSSGKEVTAETREVVKSQDLESLLKTAYSYEAADDEAKEESLLKAGKNTSSSSKKKNSKISKKKSGIKKGSSKTLPVKTAASSGVGQGSTTTPTTEVPEGGYKDGTYQGSGTGFGGTITVQVTVSGGKITAVDILSASGETGSYFASAQGVVSKVLSSQSPNVDAVSGATYSSNGIIQAVQNALSQAGNSDSATPAATPTPTPKPAKKPKKDTSVSYKDGVYEGQAEGFDGTVTVKVTIKNGKIKKISNTNTDTPEFFNKAWKTIKSNVISRQSTSEIDTVSGATFSSNGILGALSQALSKADQSGTTDSKEEDITPTPTAVPDETVTPIPTELPQPTKTPDNPSDEQPVVNLLKDGTYTGAAMGYSGQVNITLTIKDGKITEVTNTNSDTRSFFNKAWRSIQPKILEKQSTEGIDTVSGATFSSMGILDASKIALEQAKNTEVQPSVTPEPTEAPDSTEKPEPTNTPKPTSVPEPTTAPEPTAVPEPTETPAPTSAPEPTDTPENSVTPEPTAAPEPTPVPAGVYTDGTYTGIGEGNDGPDSVQVTVTISGGQIVGATYFSYDDEEYADTAWEGILGQVMGKQSADSVDTVSGCTYSSQGFIQAFRNALNQAKGA